MLNYQTKQEITTRVIQSFGEWAISVPKNKKNISVKEIPFLNDIVSFIVDQTALYYNKNEYQFKDDD